MTFEFLQLLQILCELLFGPWILVVEFKSLMKNYFQIAENAAKSIWMHSLDTVFG